LDGGLTGGFFVDITDFFITASELFLRAHPHIPDDQ
jgi:hypothetical protein